MIYQKYCPSDKLQDEIYNKWLKRYTSDDLINYRFNPYSAKKTIYNISEINQLINILSKKPANCKILDFGMGWGGFVQAARLMGLEAYGIELSNDKIQYNRSNGLKIISWEEISSYSFDFINVQQVFEHVDKPFQILKYLLGGLTDKGFMKISVPDASNVKSNLKKDFKSEWFHAKGKSYSLNPVEPLQHLNGFNYKSLIIMTSLLGLRELKNPIGNFQKNSVGVLSYNNLFKYTASSIYHLINRLQGKNTNLLLQKVK